MEKFSGILLCTDLDGTVLDSNKNVSKENLDAIEYFKSNGGLFTFITGRMPMTSRKICAVLNPNVPYGCINGGGIYDHVKNEMLWMTHLPRTALRLVDVVYETMPDMGILVDAPDIVYFSRDNSAMVKFRKITELPDIFKYHNDVTEPIAKIIFAHEDNERICKLAELLNLHPLAGEFDFIRSAQDLYEILPKGNSKGGVLVRMAEMLGVSMDKTIAVGDYDNDISMIRAAKIGYAVANASEGAKKAADIITVSNNEHAIAKIIDDLDKKKIEL
ncbi:MAG: HAD family phosphatase [Clostridia bacterium]|nr:HAD family phosphatase [Clostridia bacterium]